MTFAYYNERPPVTKADKPVSVCVWSILRVQCKTNYGVIVVDTLF